METFYEMTRDDFLNKYGDFVDSPLDDYKDLPSRSSIGKPNEIEFVSNYEGASYDVVRYNDSEGKCQGILLCRGSKIITLGITPDYQGQGITQKMADVARENGVTGIRLPSPGSTKGAAVAFHRTKVWQALVDGISVPERVLKNYPELVEQARKIK